MQMSVARHVICSNAAGWTLVSPRLSTSHACPLSSGSTKRETPFAYCYCTVLYRDNNLVHLHLHLYLCACVVNI